VAWYTIGENGSGKSKVFRAMRLLLDDNMIRFANRLDQKDFHRGIGKWQGHWIIVSIEFQDVRKTKPFRRSSFTRMASSKMTSSIGQLTTSSSAQTEKSEDGFQASPLATTQACWRSNRA
jgi:predicted ATP-dependent endonuclease of OLD family